MPHLIPEKRLDRNGRLVTKHVKASPALSQPKAVLPSPSMASAVKPKRVPAARTKPFRWDTYKSLCGADDALIKATDQYNPHLNYYFEASDVEAYEVMSVVAPRNIMPLLASLKPGYRTRENVVSLLRKANLEHLVEDNSGLAEEALSRNIPARTVQMMTDEFPMAHLSPNYMDAMEAYSVKGIRDSNLSPGYPKRVLEGLINISDLKVLGPTRIKAGGSGTAIATQLEKIKDGTSRLTVKELADVITAISEQDKPSSTMVNEAIWFAEEYGSELTMNLNNVATASQLGQHLVNIDYDEQRREDVIYWNDELRDGPYVGYIPPEDVLAFFEAGIKPQDVTNGLKQKMSAQQIIAVHAEGVPSAVSGGWL